MLRHRNARRLLGGVLVTVGLLSMALPAHAGTVTVSDPGGDTLDPILTQNDQTTFHAPAPSADITSSTLTGNTNGSLTASITVAGTIPAEGSTDPTAYQGPKATGAVATGQEYPAFVGGTYLIAYADTRLMTNNYQVGCTDVAGNPKYFLDSHWQDGYREYIAVEVTFDGTKWNYTPEYGIFDPTASGGFSFFELGAGEYSLSTTASPSWPARAAFSSQHSIPSSRKIRACTSCSSTLYGRR